MTEEMSTEEAQKFQSASQVEEASTKPPKVGEVKEVDGKTFIYYNQEWHEPPDRVCVDRQSPYHNPFYVKLGVKFNDKVTFDVHEYCISEGWILKEMRGPRNRVIYERGVARTIKLQGKVEPYWR